MEDEKVENNSLQELSNENATSNIENDNSQVIAPTQELVNEEQKQVNLSSIIPSSNINNNDDATVLVSKDSNLKTDGVVVLADLSENEFKLRENTELPNQIDIEARAEMAKKNKDSKKKVFVEDSKLIEEGKKKFQSIMSLISLIIIGGLVGFYFYYKNVPRDSNFKAKQVVVELGQSLPTSKTEYVIPGIGTTVDEMAYSLDTSNVLVDKVGEYTYTVIHNNIRKNGLIIVKDTTAPELDVREVVLSVGESYDAARFVANCTDLSGCSYSFLEQGTESKYTEAGTYTVYVAAKDAYDNQTVKQASLIIEAEGMAKYFIKEEPYNFNEGYQLTEKYELHFTNFLNDAIILNGIHTSIYTYQDQNKYDAIYKEHYGDVNYNFDNNKKIVTLTEKTNTVGYNYTKLGEVTNYLSNQGFKER